MRRPMAALLVGLVVLLSGCGDPSVGQRTGGSSVFVQRSGSKLVLNGSSFSFAGPNIYFLMYESADRVDAALDAAVASRARVIRTWAFYDVTRPEDSPHGVYFQTYDPALGRPVVNHGPTGLGRLDQVIKKASDRGLRLILTLTNNFQDFGGMDRYVEWLQIKQGGDRQHRYFYEKPTIRAWFKSYITEVVNHQNTAYPTPRRYKDDPTIFAFELANEPRCPDCGRDPSIVTRWADEMSAHIRSQDQNHLIGVGDEGFYCGGNPAEYTEQCAESVDSIALSRLANVDYMSAHLYPDNWGHRAEAVTWGRGWIARHVNDAKSTAKPFVLGEFGLADRSTRNTAYQAWTKVVEDNGGAGDLFWMLAGNPAPDPGGDPFWLYCPDADAAHGDREVCATLRQHAEFMAARR